MYIEVKFNKERAIADLDKYREGISKRVLARTLNRTATTVRATASRLIADELKPIRVGEVRKSIRITRARPNYLVSRVTAAGRRIVPVGAFSPRQTKTGVTVKIGGKTYNIAHAFINQKQSPRGRRVHIRAPSFHAQRVGATEFRSKRAQGGGYWNKGSNRRGTQRRFVGGDYPIAEIFAPGIPSVFIEKRILDSLVSLARKRFDEVIAQEIKFLESKGK